MINIKYLFCDFSLDKGGTKEFSSGDIIECHNCYEFNDCDTVIEVASEDGNTLALACSEIEIKKAIDKFIHITPIAITDKL